MRLVDGHGFAQHRNRTETPVVVTRILASTLPGLAASIVWALLVGTGAGPWERGPALLLGSWLLVLSTVSLVGMVVDGSRWARRLGFGLAVGELAVAVAVTPTPAWWLGVVLSAGSVAVLSGPVTRGWVRSRPRADAPPPRSVALATLLLITPGVLAATGIDGLGWAWVWAATSVASLLLYTRAASGAVTVVRVAPPVAGLVALAGSPLPVAVATALTAGTVTALAWTADARVAARPLVERGRAVPIPPELVPDEILDAAGLDRRGRRKAAP
jgi:hypothetical protein